VGPCERGRALTECPFGQQRQTFAGCFQLFFPRGNSLVVCAARDEQTRIDRVRRLSGRAVGLGFGKVARRRPAPLARAAIAGSRPSDLVRGILLMCLGVSMFPFMNAAVKLLTAHYPVMQIVWARFTGHLVFMLVVFLPRDGWRLFTTRRPDIQFGRSLLMLVSNLVFVAAIGRVPLATASAIGFTAPLLVTALSVPLLGEPVGWRRWSAVSLGFGGALLVIRPGLGFVNPAVPLLLVSSGCYALYQIATRWIAASTVPRPASSLRLCWARWRRPPSSPSFSCRRARFSISRCS
jgi:hypothetical protein